MLPELIRKKKEQKKQKEEIVISSRFLFSAAGI
jgi:hypothetical protein